jgi:hypothetical protein
MKWPHWRPGVCVIRATVFGNAVIERGVGSEIDGD